MPNVQADWTVKLDCECPGCKEIVDLTMQDDFWSGIHAGEPRKGQEVSCPNCGEEFTADFVY